MEIVLTNLNDENKGFGREYRGRKIDDSVEIRSAFPLKTVRDLITDGIIDETVDPVVDEYGTVVLPLTKRGSLYYMVHATSCFSWEELVSGKLEYDFYLAPEITEAKNTVLHSWELFENYMPVLVYLFSPAE